MKINRFLGKRGAMPQLGLLALSWAGAMMVSGDAEAAKTIGEISQNVASSMQGAAVAVNAIAYISGGVLCLVGLFKFKSHKDNPRDVPLSTPIFYIGLAAACLFLPEVFGTGAKTLWGDGARGTVQMGTTFN